MTNPADVLKFWFEDHGQDDWFGARPEFDAEITAGFAATHAALSRGEGWGWRSTPSGRLAEIIVLDQFSRQLHRGSARAFASDDMALALAQEAVAGGHDLAVPAERRSFFYMPYEHSESLVIHAEAERLFVALGDEEMLKYERDHAEIIRRFGRFPKRNAALGRETTPEEAAYLAEIGDRMF